MTLDRLVVKETDYSRFITKELLEQWADIPVYSENDPQRPEWRATPTFALDLSKHGYDTLVWIKNEADVTSNPTQTIKDRAAWELVTVYRDIARSWLMDGWEKIIGDIIPRFSLITAGNDGRAIASSFEKYSIPPAKLLLHSEISPERLMAAQSWYADVYLTDLNQKSLETKDILRLTNNLAGLNATAVRLFEPQTRFYDWHVHEAFNQEPDEIYVPYGSGRIFENYVAWQARTLHSEIEGAVDPRLKITPGKVKMMSILGAMPKSAKSIADKLSARFRPFTIFTDNDITGARDFEHTGKHTGIYLVSEDSIFEAYSILSQHCDTEPSGSAGLALYLERFSQAKVVPRKNILIINTGKGI